jgi:hypothetical protein
MKHVPKKITTILLLFLAINLMSAGLLTPEPTRAAGLSQAAGVRQDDSTIVFPTLDQTRAVTQVISAEGGQITVTAGDGTRFTLVIPPKALLSEAEIKMTPVIQVGELPLSGGLVAAVQLEPEGLLLWEPASLTIEPVIPLPVEDQLSFSWRQEGERFHPYPLTLDPSVITMNLVHFSGYGVGRGTDREGDSAAPANQQDQLESNAEKQTRTERKFRKLNPDLNRKKLKKRNRALCENFSGSVLAFFDVFKKQFDSTLASRDEAKLRCVLNDGLIWERFAKIEQAFAGCAPEQLAQAIDTLNEFRLKALSILADKAYERCGSDKGVEGAIQLIRLSKEARQYAGSYSDGVTEIRFALVADQIEEKAKKCARFELQFESLINIDKDDTAFAGRVSAKVPIQLFPANDPLAKSKLEYRSYSISDPQCRTDPDCCVVTPGPTVDSTFTVLDIKFDLNLDDVCSGTSEQEATLISIIVYPDPPFETINLCGRITPPTTLWAGGFGKLHLDEVSREKIGFVIREWNKGQNQLVARKTYERSGTIADAIVTEKTSFELFHRPE